MVKTIDMQEMRYLNLFEKVTRVRTHFCFFYNEAIVFCVPRVLVSKAVGENGKNVKKLSEILKKKIKILSAPKGIEDAEKFIKEIVSPVVFKEFAIKDNEFVITAGRLSKAALLGRGKRRLMELQNVSRDFFHKELKVV